MGSSERQQHPLLLERKDGTLVMVWLPLRTSRGRGDYRLGARSSDPTYPLSDPRRLGDSPVHVRHNERADRVVITAAPKTHMTVVILTRLHLFTLEQVAGWDVEPAGNRLYQLIAGDREAIHVAAAGQRIPRMRRADRQEVVDAA